MLRSWLASLMEEQCAPVSINRKLASARAFYTFLRRKGWLQLDPSTKLRSVPMAKRPPTFVAEAAMNKLFDEGVFEEDWMGLRDRLTLELLYGTGIRLSELVGLTIHDLDLSSRLIHVVGKRSKERLVPITIGLAALIEQYLTLRAPVEPTAVLLLTDSGKDRKSTRLNSSH